MHIFFDGFDPDKLMEFQEWKWPFLTGATFQYMKLLGHK